MTTEERRAKFEEYNPYAAICSELLAQEEDDLSTGELLFTLAPLSVAYELARLRAELHFAGKRGGSE
jgi:hypothetical protein